MDFTHLLEKSAKEHRHLCPRQILGVRIGLAGMFALGFREPPAKKRLLVIVETDGCFVDGIIAATDCTVGHRSLRIEDYGKVAATFIDTKTERAIRIAPRLDIRDRAPAYVSEESRPYFTQLRAYKVMPDEEMLSIQRVVLSTPIAQILSRPGVRINCAGCGEEIMNEREIHQHGLVFCHTCANGGYYQSAEDSVLHISQLAVS